MGGCSKFPEGSRTVYRAPSQLLAGAAVLKLTVLNHNGLSRVGQQKKK